MVKGSLDGKIWRRGVHKSSQEAKKKTAAAKKSSISDVGEFSHHKKLLLHSGYMPCCFVLQHCLTSSLKKFSTT
jgi:hypothetical protein